MLDHASEISKSLVAYATIASSAETSSSIYTAFQPFIVQSIVGLESSIADPEKISEAMFSLFGLRIPPLAVEGMFPALCDAGVLKYERIGNDAIYELEDTIRQQHINENFHETIRESEVKNCFDRIEQHVKIRLREHSYSYDKKKLAEQIRGAIIDPKILFDVDIEDSNAYLNRDSAIEFYTLEYVAISQQERSADFDVITKIAAGGMAVNFLEAFSLPSTLSERHRARVFFDTKILLAICDFGDSKSQVYYKDVQNKLRDMNIEVYAFSENIEETCDVVLAVMGKLQQREVPTRDVGRRLSHDGGARKRAQLLLTNSIAYFKKIGIKIFDVKKDYSNLVKYFPYAEEQNLVPDLRRGGEIKSREIDAAVIANVGRLLRHAGRTSSDIFSAPCIFVSPNQEMVEFGEKVLLEGQYTREGQAPGLMSDVQFATAVWLASGVGQLSIPRSRLLSNCAELVSANAEIYERVRSFIAGIDEKDAHFFEAQIREDRSALLVASRFVTHPSAINEESSFEVLKEIKEQIRKEEKEKAEEKLGKQAEEYTVRIDAMSADHDTEIRSLIANHDKKIMELGEYLENSSRELDNVRLDLQESEKKREDKARILEEYKEKFDKRQSQFEKKIEKERIEVEKERKKRFVPIIMAISVLLIYLASQELGAMSWNFDKKSEIFGVSLDEGSWSILALTVNIILSFVVAKISTRLFG